MRARPLIHLLGLLAPVGLLWLAAAQGVSLAPWAVAVTVAVAATLAALRLARGLRWQGPLAWLVALAGWVAVDGLLRPVALPEAAQHAGVAAVAVLLAVAGEGPLGARACRWAVAAAGGLTAAWLVGERLLLGGRPGGPLENANLSAVVALFDLAILPRMRLRNSAGLALGALLLAGIAASSSRAALLGALVLSAAWGWGAVGRRVRWAAVAVVVAAAAALAARVATDRDPLRFERLRIWQVAGRTALAELPLGCGPSGYADAALAHNFPRSGELARFHRLPALAESDFLQLAATLGLPGLLLGAGLAASILRRLGGAPAWGAVAALAATAAVHTQLAVPVVAWTATLMLVGVLSRRPGTRLRLKPSAAGALALAVAVPAAAALASPPWGVRTSQGAVTAAVEILRRKPHDDAALADAEAMAYHATSVRPRFARAWSVLGAVRLARATLRQEPALAAAAAEAYAQGRRANPLDSFAAIGEGRARRLLGDTTAARRALQAAVALEPNAAVAWLEIALLDLEAGELGAARSSLRRVEAALAAARGRRLVTDYERALVAVNAGFLTRLRLRCGAGR
ncbi:MAG: O-antigen ligase family protein [Acidobacteriota bacterium]